MSVLPYKKRVADARKLVGETREQFAKRFFVTPGTIATWERGEREAPYDVLEACETLLGYPQLCDKCGGSGLIVTGREMENDGR